MLKADYIKNIHVVSQKMPADLVIKNGKIIDVFNLEILEGDIAIANGFIVGIGTYEGHKVIDAKGKYIAPSFIDSHVHIESSLVTPKEFAKIVVPHGVTTVVTDPHELANVAGEKGLEFIIQDAKNLPLDVVVMLPSCVPATPFENAGAVLTANELKPFYEQKTVGGLAEVMDLPSVQNASEDIINKIADAHMAEKIIDGHCAGLDNVGINIFRSINIRTDHECTTVADAKSRVERGMYVNIREGSVAKDIKGVLPAVTERNARRFTFCTDDKFIDDLLEEGSIDHNIRLAIKEGMNPLQAIQLATINAAECHQLKEKGAIAPGYLADFVMINDLEKLEITQVYKHGKLVAENGKMTVDIPNSQIDDELLTSVFIPHLQEKHLILPMSSNKANIIGIIPNSILTNHLVDEVTVVDNHFIPSTEKDQLKIVVAERHNGTKNVGIGIVTGFGITEGAFATTVAHDSHNIVATGTNDADIFLAMKTLEKMQGGEVVVKNGEVLATLSLSIGGIIATESYQEVITALKEIDQALKELGFKKNFNPMITLSFLSLPVIPDLKLTDTGLFDVKKFTHISVESN